MELFNFSCIKFLMPPSIRFDYLKNSFSASVSPTRSTTGRSHGSTNSFIFPPTSKGGFIVPSGFCLIGVLFFLFTADSGLIISPSLSKIYCELSMIYKFLLAFYFIISSAACSGDLFMFLSMASPIWSRKLNDNFCICSANLSFWNLICSTEGPRLSS